MLALDPWWLSESESESVKKNYCLTLFFLGLTVALHAEIPKPTDAPKPLPPAESLKRFNLPPGYRLELVASEPLKIELLRDLRPAATDKTTT